MQTSYWGYWLVVFGVAIVGIMIPIQALTTNTTQDYLSVKEVTEAAMLEAVDYGYYRDYNEVKMNKEKFMEVFLRMLSENMGRADTYKVSFYGLYEAPPKVSVEIKSSSGTNFVSEGFDLTTRYDAVIQIHAREVETTDTPGTSGSSGAQTPGGSTGTGGGGTTTPGGTTPSGTGTGTGGSGTTTPGGTTPGGSGEVTPASCSGTSTNIDATNMKGYIMEPAKIYTNENLSSVLRDSKTTSYSTSPEVVTIVGMGKSKSSSFEIKTSDGECGWIDKKYIAVNLQEYLSGYKVEYPLTNKSNSIYQVTTRQSETGDGRFLKDTVYKLNLGKLYTNDYLPLARYNFASKLKPAVVAASSDGYTLQIYDAYRPTSVSAAARDKLKAMIDGDSSKKIWNVLHTSYGSSGKAYTWEMDTSMGDSRNSHWFLAGTTSAHNRACAVDISIKGGTMPSAMHELSTWSIKYYANGNYLSPKSTSSERRSAGNYAASMTESAILLDHYMTDIGKLNDLASEWWHFQDSTTCNNISSSSNFWSNV